MPLFQTVANHPDIGRVSTPNPPQRVLVLNGPTGPMEFPVSCHAATCYWILTDLDGAEPQHDDAVLLQAQPAVRKMIATGRKLTANDASSLTAGSVIVFVKNNGDAGHSCVAIDKSWTAGYNQNGWFPNGKVDQYSSHQLSQLKWGTKATAGKIIAWNGTAYDLYQIPEGSAKLVVSSY